MIQGGDPLGQGFGGPGYVFDDEPHPDQTFNDRDYLLAMANAGIRNGKGTNGSQFFITVPTPRRPTHLNGKHTIFGEVVDDGQPQGRGPDRRRADRRAGPAAAAGGHRDHHDRASRGLRPMIAGPEETPCPACSFPLHSNRPIETGLRTSAEGPP